MLPLLFRCRPTLTRAVVNPVTGINLVTADVNIAGVDVIIVIVTVVVMVSVAMVVVDIHVDVPVIPIDVPVIPRGTDCDTCSKCQGTGGYRVHRVRAAHVAGIRF
jgi:hypothetical protein